MLFKENNLMDMIETLAFLKSFDCIVVSEASVPEETMQQVLASFEKICSRDTKSLNKYYSMAEENRDLYAKMTYVNKLVYGRPLDLIPVSYTHLDVYKRQHLECMVEQMI